MSARETYLTPAVDLALSRAWVQPTLISILPHPSISSSPPPCLDDGWRRPPLAPSLASRSVEAASLGERWGGGRFLRELWRRACTWSNSAASALVTALKSEPVRSQRNCTSRARSPAPHVHAPCGHASYLLGVCQHGGFATIAATATRGRRPCPPAPMPVPAPNPGPSNSLHTTTGSRFPGAAPSTGTGLAAAG